MIPKNIKRYCKDYTKIENYEQALASDELWVAHHRREVQQGIQIWTKSELIAIRQYYNREPEELIFMPQTEHRQLHKNTFDPKRKCLVKSISDDQKEKLSKARKGKKPWNKGKIGVQPWTETSKEKLKMTLARSEVKSRMYTEERAKKISEARKKLHKVYNEDGTYRMVPKE